MTNNLEEPIIEALQNSEWLIVICSPRLPESVWCKKEIETFISLRGREHVLAVLVEGEPSESFPEELLYKIQSVTLDDGTTQQVKVPVEPLAADFRGENKKGVEKAMKMEKLRLLAAMFGVEYDDLRQRHRERRLRRIATVSAFIGAACLLFGTYCAFTAIRIQKQKEQIEEQSARILVQSDEILKQNEEIRLKSDEIIKQNEEIQKQNEELALKHAKALAEQAERYLAEGNRDAAVKAALESLTISDGIQMPYTPEAEMVLAECLRVYDVGQVYKAEHQYVADCKIVHVKESPDLDTIAMLDDAGAITLLDADKLEVIAVIPAEELKLNSNSAYAFLGTDRFLYVNNERNINVYNLTEKRVEQQIGQGASYIVLTDVSGNYIVTDGTDPAYYVYDGNTYEKIGEKSKIADYTNLVEPFIFPEGVMIYTTCVDETENSEYTLHFLDISTMEVISEYFVGGRKPYEIKIRDGILYMLAAEYTNKYMDSDCYTMAVDMSTGEILWEIIERSRYPKAMRLPGIAESDIMLSAVGAEAQAIDMNTGEIVNATVLSSDVVSAYRYVENGNFLIFCTDGTMHLMSIDQNVCANMSARFNCVTSGNQDILKMKRGILALREYDNTLTLYVAKEGPKVQEIEEKVERTVYAEVVNSDEVLELAVSYGLENPQYIQKCFYSDDQKYCFVQYWDRTLLIYEVGVGICTTISNAEYIDGYISGGTDGKSYLLCSVGCYVLNEDMQPIAWIDQVKDVDVQNNILYMQQSLYSFSSPIYSLEELIQMAKEWK